MVALHLEHSATPVKSGRPLFRDVDIAVALALGSYACLTVTQSDSSVASEVSSWALACLLRQQSPVLRPATLHIMNSGGTTM